MVRWLGIGISFSRPGESGLDERTVAWPRHLRLSLAIGQESITHKSASHGCDEAIGCEQAAGHQCLTRRESKAP